MMRDPDPVGSAGHGREAPALGPGARAGAGAHAWAATRRRSPTAVSRPPPRDSSTHRRRSAAAASGHDAHGAGGVSPAAAHGLAASAELVGLGVDRGGVGRVRAGGERGAAVSYVVYGRRAKVAGASTSTSPRSTATATATATSTATATATATTTATSTATATADPDLDAPTSAKPVASSAPPVTDVGSLLPAAGASEGVLVLPASAAGHRVYVDGKLKGDGATPIVVSCGKHTVKVGSAGASRAASTCPCGKTVTM